MTREIASELEIAALPHRTCKELDALDSYPGRNLYVHRILGRLGRFLTPKLFDGEYYFLIPASKDRVCGLKERAEKELP